jgi:tRNA threonylcarbamoyladenosine biosynthesis protein TsaE
MSSWNLDVPDADAMRECGAHVAAQCRAGDLVVLTGPLGAGKTTFAQGFAEGLGVSGAVTSPTYVIAREHASTHGGPALLHVDAYRLGGVEEVDDLDLERSLGEAVTVVEWGEGLVEHLDAAVIHVRISRDDGTDSEVRRVTVQWPQGRG